MCILFLPQEVAVSLQFIQVLPAELASENIAIFLQGGVF